MKYGPGPYEKPRSLLRLDAGAACLQVTIDYGSVAQTTSSNHCSRYSPAKDERVPQDALGLIDSPLPGPSWHTDALTAAFFFVSSLKAWRFQ